MHRNIRHFRSKPGLLLVFLLLYSCKPQEKPPIPVETMKNILLDIHLAEAYSSVIVRDSVHKARYNKELDSLSLFYKQILGRNKVAPDAFEQALKWYALHPDKLDSVYSGIAPVLDSLKTKIPPNQ
ncbi:MAG TPA: DUF4296 domain-containing protein [Chitinophagaceae bacterium]|nr:DUF4296 domain-containing protein [Chitinophagaceae bacterium]